MAGADDRSQAGSRGGISAFVITADQDHHLLQAVLKSARFADEVILVDKGHRAAGAWSHADRVFRAPWSPTVEDTREIALNQCSHDWVICLDDDEILSPACAEAFRDFIHLDRSDVLMVPIKNYVLGRFDERAYYWPEWRPALFRRGAVSYTETVHGGTTILGAAERLRDGHEAFITHLSHADVATWIEKTNRYTSQKDRSGDEAPPPGRLVAWAADRLTRYATRNLGGDDYLDAVALLRGLYDVVDGLKRWEATQPNGHAEFRRLVRERGGYEED